MYINIIYAVYNCLHVNYIRTVAIIVTDEINTCDDNATNVATLGAPTVTYIKRNDAVIINDGSEASTGMYRSNDSNTTTSQTAGMYVCLICSIIICICTYLYTLYCIYSTYLC